MTVNAQARRLGAGLIATFLVGITALERPVVAGPTEVSSEELTFTDEEREFWAFQTPFRPDVPSCDTPQGWCRNPIDRFVLRKHREHDLEPAPAASRRELIRRLSFDLHGLPPAPEDVARFLSDEEPGAYERLVDRYLRSPRYGERWARHWLDVVRYAESDGYKQDAFRPHAWRYRDYVIRAFNEDRPVDRFLQEQLAGDELFPDDLEALAGTQFLRLGIYEYNQSDVRGQWKFLLDELTDVTGEALLGLGMGCARCHDHKFDPIRRRDYYRLRAFFAPIVFRDDRMYWNDSQRERMRQWKKKTAELRHRMDEFAEPFKKKAGAAKLARFPEDIQAIVHKPAGERTPHEKQLFDLAWRQIEDGRAGFVSKMKGEAKERWQELTGELEVFEDMKPRPAPAMSASDIGAVAPPTRIPGEDDGIEPGFPAVLDPGPAPVKRLDTAPESTGRRAALARWLTRDDHPLVPRVFVNRIWQHHFGRGIVATPSDFGTLGGRPSHPELLDWLTREFVEGGWRAKPIHRLIVTSATYRQSSRPAASATLEKDPENRWLARAVVRRLDAGQIRDAMLSITGELELADGGPSVDPATPRRTIYTKVYRNHQPALMQVFDTPDGYTSVAERNVTTTAPQALFLLNNEWTRERARTFARRLLRDVRSTAPGDLLTRAYELAYARQPEPAEAAAALEFLGAPQKAVATTASDSSPVRESTEDGPAIETPLLIDLCHVILNSNELIYVD